MKTIYGIVYKIFSLTKQVIDSIYSKGILDTAYFEC